MALRAFKTTFLIAVDVDGAEDEDGGPVPEPDVEAAKDFLEGALVLDVNEGNALAVGFASAEVLIDELTELTAEEVRRLYGRPKSADPPGHNTPTEPA